MQALWCGDEHTVVCCLVWALIWSQFRKCKRCGVVMNRLLCVVWVMSCSQCRRCKHCGLCGDEKVELSAVMFTDVYDLVTVLEVKHCKLFGDEETDCSVL